VVFRHQQQREALDGEVYAEPVAAPDEVEERQVTLLMSAVDR
jgi:hypothetical protein